MSALPVFLQIGRIEGLLTAAGVLAPRHEPAPEPPQPPPSRKTGSSMLPDPGGLVDRSTPAPAPVASWGGRTAAHG